MRYVVLGCLVESGVCVASGKGHWVALRMVDLEACGETVCSTAFGHLLVFVRVT